MKTFTISPGNIPNGMKLHGILPDFTRMPQDAAAKVSSSVLSLSRCSSGGRIRFRTNSRTITVSVTLESASMNSGIDVLCDGALAGRVCPNDNDDTFFTGTVSLEDNSSEQNVKDEVMRDVTVYMPRTAPTCEMILSLEDDASVEEATPYKPVPPIVYYGSSITMGASAQTPSRCYVSLVSERLNMDHINLGFGGACKGELAMAEYISTLDMSAFVMDYEHNADTLEYLRETHKPFFDFVRAARPNLPILIISRPDTDREPLRSALGRRIVMDTYHAALDSGDTNVGYIDGFYLWGNDNREACTSDGCHPSELGFACMADVIAPRLHQLIRGISDGEHVPDSVHPQRL